MLPPYVGILVNDRLYHGIPSGKTHYEEIALYEQFCAKFGTQPCFFRLQDYKRGAAELKALVCRDGSYVEQSIPVPKVIHNRAIYPGKKEKRMLEAWADRGYRLFNRWNRYGKLYIHRLLWSHRTMRPHLPETMRATKENILGMMSSFNSLIIKPDRSSIGRGIMKLWRTKKGWKLSYPAAASISNTTWHTISWRGFRLPKVLLRRIGKTKYIVQQCLLLAAYEGRPFDLRVSVQRGANGEWQVTGMIARVAAKDAFLTNVGQGGTPYQVEPLLQSVYPDGNVDCLIAGIERFALDVVLLLGNKMPHLADLGLDIGLDQEAKPLFIECNGKDQRYTLKQAGLDDAWKATYENPMAYASYLLKNGSFNKQ
ncbi:YheC/YheD family protein [Paenibacillus sp. GD4]|uniref:YheC/YheD family endospore coat-associated protein n=1 Tax=Paenibacillus sp. GD4 TaxID=3068890 RepID=UPI00279696F5|nr:YheC/YheD family protein [Paenibacillus sp. GD4]MDQ1912278.1 YheC/YheD family protein [Paenibacillus sp. GD4]